MRERNQDERIRILNWRERERERCGESKIPDGERETRRMGRMRERKREKCEEDTYNMFEKRYQSDRQSEI